MTIREKALAFTSELEAYTCRWVNLLDRCQTELGYRISHCTRAGCHAHKPCIICRSQQKLWDDIKAAIEDIG